MVAFSGQGMPSTGHVALSNIEKLLTVEPGHQCLSALMNMPPADPLIKFALGKFTMFSNSESQSIHIAADGDLA